MTVDDEDPRKIARDAERLADANEPADDELEDEIEDDELDDEAIELHAQLRDDREELVDEDEREEDEILRGDRKELSELGSELDNPEGFAEEERAASGRADIRRITHAPRRIPCAGTSRPARRRRRAA